MLSKEQNDLLTRTGPGTPGGALLRRYWQPVALAEELPPGGAPLPVRLLGEELVLFRDEQGRPGLLGLHCAHRGADLSYGRLEDGGLRCLYHGWLYDVEGRCLEQPGEPSGSTFCERVRQKAYPCREAGGMLLAYLGPGAPPELPAYEFLTAPAQYHHVAKVHNACNYLQGNEGNIDPVHLSYLHAFQPPPANGEAGDQYEIAGVAAMVESRSPSIELEETDYGIRIYTVRLLGSDKQYLRVTNFVYPNLSAFTGPLADGYLVNWHVPIDDTNHWKYMIAFTRETPLSKPWMDQALFDGELTAEYKLTRNRDNRYGQSREAMRWSFTGIGDHPGCCFPAQDVWVVEGEGPIQDREQEHLGYSDKAIILQRKLLLQAVEDVQGGGEAPHVIRDPAANGFPQLVVVSEEIPSAVDPKAHVEQKIAARRGQQAPASAAAAPGGH